MTKTHRYLGEYHTLGRGCETPEMRAVRAGLEFATCMTIYNGDCDICREDLVRIEEAVKRVKEDR